MTKGQTGKLEHVVLNCFEQTAEYYVGSLRACYNLIYCFVFHVTSFVKRNLVKGSHFSAGKGYALFFVWPVVKFENSTPAFLSSKAR